MSRPSVHLVDGDLHAFADNVLAVDRRATILAALETDPAEGRRMADWCAQNEAIRRTLGRIAFEPVPVALSLAVTAKRAGEPAVATSAEKAVPRLVEPAIAQAKIEPRRRTRSLTRVMALVMIAAAAGLFGVASGRLGGDFGASSAPAGMQVDRAPFAVGSVVDPAAGFASRALEAHRTFVLDGQYPVEIGAAQLPRLLQWFERRLGQRLTVPDLQSVGFSLLGGRLVSGPVGPSALLVFQNAGGERLGLMIGKSDTGIGQAMRYRGAQGTGVVTWSQNASLLSLSGPAEQMRLMNAAKVAASGVRLSLRH